MLLPKLACGLSQHTNEGRGRGGGGRMGGRGQSPLHCLVSSAAVLCCSYVIQGAFSFILLAVARIPGSLAALKLYMLHCVIASKQSVSS